jgi:cytochrome b561
MKPQAYGYTAIALHWLLAGLIVCSLGVGWYMVELPMSVQRLKLFNWHKWAGITILTLSAARLVWRLTHPAPALPTSMPAWQRWASHLSHSALYALFFAIPLLGWAYSSAAGFPIVWFGVLPLPDWVPRSRELAELIKPWHGWAAYTLAAVVVVHVMAALKHHWFDKDDVLTRMLPWLRKTPSKSTISQKRPPL